MRKELAQPLICSSLFRASLAAVFFWVIATPATAQHVPGYDYDETKIPHMCCWTRCSLMTAAR